MQRHEIGLGQGFIYFGLRQIGTYSLNFLGQVLLARSLVKSDFGTAELLAFIFNLAFVFTGFGFSTSLVRSLHEPKKSEIQTLFFSHQILSLMYVLVLMGSTAWLCRRYEIPFQNQSLFYLMGFSIFFYSFALIPNALMERHLLLGKIALCDIIQAAVFNLVLAWGIYRDLGIDCVAWAFVARALTYVLVCFFSFPWPPVWSLQFKKSGFVEHLRFGMPVMAGNLLSLLKDSLSPLVLGNWLGTAAMGENKWATLVALFPSVVLSGFQRFYLAIFARVQNDKKQLRNILESSFFLSGLLVSISTAWVVATARPLTLLVFGKQWSDSIYLVYFFALASVFAVGIAPLISFLNAIGKSGAYFKFSIFSLVIMWVFGVTLIYFFGTVGIPLATIASSFQVFWLYKVARRELEFKFFREFLIPWILALCVCLPFYFIQDRIHNIMQLLLSGGLALLLFGAFVWLFQKKRIINLYQTFKS